MPKLPKYVVLAAVTMAATLAGAPSAGAYTHAWDTSECWPTYNGNWSVEASCTMPNWDLGNGTGNFCSRQVYGDMSVGGAVVTIPANCNLGINLTVQKITFTTGRVSIGSNSKLQHLGGGKYYRCYAYNQAWEQTNCPDPNYLGGSTGVMDTTNTTILNTSTNGMQINQPVLPNGTMCCARGTGGPPVNGVCGPANGVGTYNMPAFADLCTGGSTIGAVLSGNDYVWTCYGVNGGSSPNCSAPRVIDATCGGLHGTTQCTPPASLCGTAPGGASAVWDGGNGFYYQTCNGVNGGASPICWAVHHDFSLQYIGTSGADWSNYSRNDYCTYGWQQYFDYYVSNTYAGSQWFGTMIDYNGYSYHTTTDNWYDDGCVSVSSYEIYQYGCF